MDGSLLWRSSEALETKIRELGIETHEIVTLTMNFSRSVLFPRLREVSGGLEEGQRVGGVFFELGSAGERAFGRSYVQIMHLKEENS